MSELKPMFDNFVSALSDRFRQQYPQGSIVSDLVQIHGDQYVVKVSVSLENTVLVSTLAADANLMLAENRAMERALTILGIRDLQQPAHEPVNLSVTPLPDLPAILTNPIEQLAVAHESLNSATNVKLPVLATEQPTIIEEIPLAPVSAVAELGEILEQPTNFETEPSLFEPNTELTNLNANSQVATDLAQTLASSLEPKALSAKNGRTRKSTINPDPLPVATAEEQPLDETAVPIADGASEAIAEPPLSVTDMIPMINMELKRLGWSKERGREYMVSLYNKRASALLSDDELFGLLQHLQAEPIV